MKKGFTLIELLAVIVILAVIALIATPMILGVIETARESAAEASATGYIDAVEKQVMINMLDSNATQIVDGVYDLPMTGISVKGDVPEEGWIVIEKGEITNYSMKIMDYIVTKGEEVTKEGTVATKPEQVAKLCKRVTGTAGTYAVGDEFSCDPGDGTYRTFYVLENKTNEVALLMDSNIGSSAYSSDGSNANGPVTALEYLKIETTDKGWTVNVSLPEIDKINEAKTVDQSAVSWICKNAQAASPVYWTASPFPSVENNAYVVYNSTVEGCTYAGQIVSTSIYVRPVITISKNVIE